MTALSKKLFIAGAVAVAVSIGPGAAAANAEPVEVPLPDSAMLGELLAVGAQGLEVGKIIFSKLATGSGGDAVEYLTCEPNLYPAACGSLRR
ncbi:hypothetical protein [Skermania piniformis]|uniref:Uncharacterized protein n=1 Tax=Skermania pinensis TaxID=39122 RepID=A0ABX8S8E0_9ACTN|nr:hypothetical protein [Skermania piniformis]QXQ14084.1 hypothetical protein KV203_01060 [Skermania piniformis]